MCTSLDPSDSFSSLNIDKVCSLVLKFYPADFSEQERANLRCQLRHYELDVPNSPKFQNLTSVADLCRRLVQTKKVDDYHLIRRCRLIRLVLTLPVSTATIEHAFSAMKLNNTRLPNKMEDGFLRNCLMLYIEREMAMKVTTDSIIDAFNMVKNRAVKFKWKTPPLYPIESPSNDSKQAAGAPYLNPRVRPAEISRKISRTANDRGKHGLMPEWMPWHQTRLAVASSR